MSEPIKLKSATTQPDQEVIKKLEIALAKARDGKLREVLIIGSYEGGGYFHNASFKDGPLMLGYLAMVQFSVASIMDSNAEIAD
jgi:hypothetical protein